MISVVVPVYKVEVYLDKCIQSVLNQTFRNFELILVDDGSPDRCGEICDQWAEKDHRIRVIHKSNGGLSDARNAGISQAKGEWLSFVDSDDWIAEDMLETLYRLAIDHDAEISCSNFSRVVDDGKMERQTNYVQPGVLTPEEYWEQLFSAKDWAYYNVVWNKLYRRELFETVQFPYGKINEDIYVMYDLISACKRVALTDKVGYYYRIRQNSIMGRQGSIRNLDGWDAYLGRAEKFIGQKEWKYAAACLNRAKSGLLLGDFGENGKKSSAYKAIKQKTWGVYRKMIPHMAIRQNIGILFFLMGEPLYNKLRPLIRKQEMSGC